jgi:Acyl-coenzyme A synthetases/AMP-(fatty) acid ligases
MLERFLTQTSFVSEEDFEKNLHFKISENFNFAYDVMDALAEERPDKLALLWTSERSEEVKTTFKEFKEQTDRTAAYLMSLGIGRGDKVMLILKRHYQWWLSMMALCKIGAIAIPATHMRHKEWINAPEFERPENVNTNEDTMLMYFTSGTSGEPKMVAHADKARYYLSQRECEH